MVTRAIAAIVAAGPCPTRDCCCHCPCPPPRPGSSPTPPTPTLSSQCSASSSGRRSLRRPIRWRGWAASHNRLHAAEEGGSLGGGGAMSASMPGGLPSLQQMEWISTILCPSSNCRMPRMGSTASKMQSTASAMSAHSSTTTSTIHGSDQGSPPLRHTARGGGSTSVCPPKHAR
jgi:hypothetical protein